MTPSSPSTSWTLDELVAHANRQLPPKSLHDSRLSQELTARNLRRLIEQGAIDPPVRIGREAYYGSHHLEQILQARSLMSQGFAAASVKTLRSAYQTEHLEASTPSLMGSAPLASLTPTSPTSPLSTPHLSTQKALHFLGGVSAPSQSELKPQAFALDFLASTAGSHAHSSEPAHAATHSLSQAYHHLTSSSTHATPPQSVFEAQALPGLRLSLQVSAVQLPLTSSQKNAALSALEQLWAQALAVHTKDRGTS